MEPGQVCALPEAGTELPPGLIETEVAPETSQLSTEQEPVVILTGLAEKTLTTGCCAAGGGCVGGGSSGVGGDAGGDAVGDEGSGDCSGGGAAAETDMETVLLTMPLELAAVSV